MLVAWWLAMLQQLLYNQLQYQYHYYLATVAKCFYIYTSIYYNTCNVNHVKAS